MRGEIMKRFPLFAKQLGPKCMANRMGYCDEKLDDYLACPLAKVRPHKSQVLPPSYQDSIQALEETL